MEIKKAPIPASGLLFSLGYLRPAAPINLARCIEKSTAKE
jgi:hypothetical protein